MWKVRAQCAEIVRRADLLLKRIDQLRNLTLADALDTSQFILDGTPPDRKPVGAEATVSEILEKVAAAEARQVQMQSDLARLILQVEALQEDLRSTRAPGGQARGGQG